MADDDIVSATIFGIAWVWDTIVTGLWVLTAMTVVLLATATWEYRRATA